MTNDYILQIVQFVRSNTVRQLSVRWLCNFQSKTQCTLLIMPRWFPEDIRWGRNMS